MLVCIFCFILNFVLPGIQLSGFSYSWVPLSLDPLSFLILQVCTLNICCLNNSIRFSLIIQGTSFDINFFWLLLFNRSLNIFKSKKKKKIDNVLQKVKERKNTIDIAENRIRNPSMLPHFLFLTAELMVPTERLLYSSCI